MGSFVLGLSSDSLLLHAGHGADRSGLTILQIILDLLKHVTLHLRKEFVEVLSFVHTSLLIGIMVVIVSISGRRVVRAVNGMHHTLLSHEAINVTLGLGDSVLLHHGGSSSLEVILLVENLQTK